MADDDRRELTAQECERYGCPLGTMLPKDAIEALRLDWEAGLLGAFFTDAMSEANMGIVRATERKGRKK